MSALASWTPPVDLPTRGPDHNRPPSHRPGVARPVPADRRPAGAIRLLDHLPDLAGDLEHGQAATARRALMVPAIALGAGGCGGAIGATDPPVSGRAFGLLVIEGLLARAVRLGDRTSTILYGPGDVLDLRTDASSSLTPAADVICPELAVIAVLDDRVLAAMREWPRMIAGMFTIVMRQLERADINAAIGRLERVEDRLLGFFWLLADRWGRCGPDGIAIDQPLTHEAIGTLIGARRPTVSLGLRALSERRALIRRPDGSWLLSAGSLTQLIDDDWSSRLPL